MRKKVDDEAFDILDKELHSKPLEYSELARECIIDLGGASGWFGQQLKTDSNKVYCVDIKDDKFKEFDDVKYISSDIRKLPFNDKEADIVLARAVLHHIPEDIDKAYTEITRVLKDDGVLIVEEPGYYHPLAYIIRKAFPLEDFHEVDEKPFIPMKLLKDTQKYFNTIEIEYYYLFAYIMPHVISRVPKSLKRLSRDIMKCFMRIDKVLLKYGFFQQMCGYILICCKKRC